MKKQFFLVVFFSGTLYFYNQQEVCKYPKGSFIDAKRIQSIEKEGIHIPANINVIKITERKNSSG